MSFLEGFAGTLHSLRMDEHRDERELKKEGALQRMKEEYERKLVDSSLTTIEGNKQITRNKFGDIVATRELSPEEAELRAAQLSKTKADAAAAEADAGVKKKGLDYYDDDRAYGRDIQAQELALRRQQVAQGGVGNTLARERWEYEKNQQIPQRVNAAQSLLHRVGTSQDTSAASQARALQASLNGALAANDTATLLQLLAQIEGELAYKDLREKTDASTPRLQIPSVGTPTGSGIPLDTGKR
jgi:hypothetical protein